MIVKHGFFFRNDFWANCDRQIFRKITLKRLRRNLKKLIAILNGESKNVTIYGVVLLKITKFPLSLKIYLHFC